jgi:hypothetical protein
MFSLCENMKWAHLPEPGGIYAQSPELLEGFMLIFAERNEYEAEERKRQERETGKSTRGAQRSRASRPRR